MPEIILAFSAERTVGKTIESADRSSLKRLQKKSLTEKLSHTLGASALLQSYQKDAHDE